MTTVLIRPHPTKPKPLVTPVNSLAHLNRLLRQHPHAVAETLPPKKDISSGEDVYART